MKIYGAAQLSIYSYFLGQFAREIMAEVGKASVVKKIDLKQLSCGPSKKVDTVQKNLWKEVPHKRS